MLVTTYKTTWSHNPEDDNRLLHQGSSYKKFHVTPKIHFGLLHIKGSINDRDSAKTITEFINNLQSQRSVLLAVPRNKQNFLLQGSLRINKQYTCCQWTLLLPTRHSYYQLIVLNYRRKFIMKFRCNQPKLSRLPIKHHLNKSGNIKL
jgi:hypothetical protein